MGSGLSNSLIIWNTLESRISFILFTDDSKLDTIEEKLTSLLESKVERLKSRVCNEVNIACANFVFS
jgi:hypothetical protein